MKDPIQKNRAYWDQTSDEYQRMHGPSLARAPMAWGVWRIPESQIRALGEVAGRDILELGCGAGQWSLQLIASGARAVGVDFSRRQLHHALEHAKKPAGELPLVLADAEQLPFQDASFDIVFCDHGATSFARPERTVAEAARVLRSGGTFAFCMSSPLLDLCWDEAAERVTSSLVRDYFDMGEVEDANSVCYQLAYGAWIRLFRSLSLQVEDLIELQPPMDAGTSYRDYVSLEWARRWPAENIWKLRKAAS